MRMLVAEQWDQFARAVLPPGCSPGQRRNMRRVFYAGAQCVLFGVIAALSPADEPAEEDLQMMSDVQKELSDFGELIKAGRA